MYKPSIVYVFLSLLLGTLVPSWGQSSLASKQGSFTVVYEGREVGATFMARIKKGGDLDKVVIELAELRFDDPSLNDLLSMAAQNNAFNTTNGNLDFAVKKFNQKTEAEYDCQIKTTKKKLNIVINPINFECRPKDKATVNSGNTINLSYDPSSKPLATNSDNRDQTLPSQEAKPEEPPSPSPAPTNRQERPDPASRQPDPETEQYKKTLSETDNKARSEALVAFLGRFPKSQRRKEALRQVELEMEFKKQGDAYIYIFKHALAPHLQFDTAQIVASAWIEKEEHHEITLELKPNIQAAEVILFDSLKIPEFQRRKLSLKRDMEALNARLERHDDMHWKLQVTGGGNNDLWLRFYDENGPVRKLDFPLQHDTLLDLSALRSDWGQHGKLRLKLAQESEGSLGATVDVGALEIPPAPPIWPYFGVAAALGCLFWAFARYRKTAKRKAMEKKIEKRSETSNIEPATPQEAPFSPEADVAEGASAFKIKRAQTTQHQALKALSETSFDQLLTEAQYCRLELSRHWPSTALTELALHPESIKAIDQFLHQQRKHFLQEEKEGSLPEIGGFLLGHYCFSESMQRFRATIEAFVPIVPEDNSAFLLQFSNESLVRELGEAQDLYHGFSVVGWFHTHPGHGLFLSKPDLAIQDGFFRERYQFAMEIDTLSHHWDTGFFTRQTSGASNNADTLMPGSNWFKWGDIHQTIEQS